MGKIIALSGVDNAGKSTQSKLLVDYFTKQGKKVKTTDFAFGYYFLKPVIKYLRKSTGSPKGGPVKRNKKALPKLWFIPAFIDIWVGYVFYLLPMRNKYDVIIADRFYSDIWVNLLFYGYLPKWAFKPLLRFLPKPDTTFVLLIKSKTGFARIRDEFPLSYYLEQTKIYKSLSENIDCYTIIAETEPSKAFENIARKINA